MPKPNERATRTALPVRLAVRDNLGKLRALVENYTDALTVFANLNLDKLDRDKYPKAELEHHMTVSGWTVEALKPLVPATNGKNLLWDTDALPPDNPPPPGETVGFIVWLR